MGPDQSSRRCAARPSAPNTHVPAQAAMRHFIRHTCTFGPSIFYCHGTYILAPPKKTLPTKTRVGEHPLQYHRQLQYPHQISSPLPPAPLPTAPPKIEVCPSEMYTARLCVALFISFCSEFVTAIPPRAHPRYPATTSSPASLHAGDLLHDTILSFPRAYICPPPKPATAPGFDPPGVTVGMGCGRETSDLSSPHQQLTSTPIICARTVAIFRPKFSKKNLKTLPPTAAPSKTAAGRIPLLRRGTDPAEKPVRGVSAACPILVAARSPQCVQRASQHVHVSTEPRSGVYPPCASVGLTTPPSSGEREDMPATRSLSVSHQRCRQGS